MATEIEVVPCLSDNYAYLVKSGSQCAVVDPSGHIIITIADRA